MSVEVKNIKTFDGETYELVDAVAREEIDDIRADMADLETTINSVSQKATKFVQNHTSLGVVTLIMSSVEQSLKTSYETVNFIQQKAIIDPNNNFLNIASGAITVTAGVFLVAAHIFCKNLGSGDVVTASVFKNDMQMAAFKMAAIGEKTNGVITAPPIAIQCASGDILQLKIKNSRTSGVVSLGENETFLTVQKVG